MVSVVFALWAETKGEGTGWGQGEEEEDAAERWESQIDHLGYLVLVLQMNISVCLSVCLPVFLSLFLF